MSLLHPLVLSDDDDDDDDDDDVDDDDNLFGWNGFRGRSRAVATSKMERFAIIVSSPYLLSQSAPSWMLQQP